MPPETSNELSLKNVPIRDNNKIDSVPIITEENLSNNKIVAWYATLELNIVCCSQVPRRQIYNLPPKNKMSNKKGFWKLHERQWKKNLEAKKTTESPEVLELTITIILKQYWLALKDVIPI